MDFIEFIVVIAVGFLMGLVYIALNDETAIMQETDIVIVGTEAVYDHNTKEYTYKTTARSLDNSISYNCNNDPIIFEKAKSKTGQEVRAKVMVIRQKSRLNLYDSYRYYIVDIL